MSHAKLFALFALAFAPTACGAGTTTTTRAAGPAPTVLPVQSPKPATIAASPGEPPLPKENGIAHARECKLVAHPLAEALTREGHIAYEAFQCAEIDFGRDIVDDVVGMVVPGIVVRAKDAVADDAPDANRDHHARGWATIERYAREIGLSAPRSELRPANMHVAAFVQRVSGTEIDVEGAISVYALGTAITEIRFSLVATPKVVGRPGFIKATSVALAHETKRGVVSPRIVGTPRAFVSRNEGLVWDLDVAGVDMAPLGIRATRTRRLRIDGQGEIVSEGELPARQTLMR